MLWGLIRNVYWRSIWPTLKRFHHSLKRIFFSGSSSSLTLSWKTFLLPFQCCTLAPHSFSPKQEQCMTLTASWDVYMICGTNVAHLYTTGSGYQTTIACAHAWETSCECADTRHQSLLGPKHLPEMFILFMCAKQSNKVSWQRWTAPIYWVTEAPLKHVLHYGYQVINGLPVPCNCLKNAHDFCCNGNASLNKTYVKMHRHVCFGHYCTNTDITETHEWMRMSLLKLIF